MSLCSVIGFGERSDFTQQMLTRILKVSHSGLYWKTPHFGSASLTSLTLRFLSLSFYLYFADVEFS